MSLRRRAGLTDPYRATTRTVGTCPDTAPQPRARASVGPGSRWHSWEHRSAFWRRPEPWRTRRSAARAPKGWTAKRETLAGRGGDDLLLGKVGDDGLPGGEGEDELYGGAGRDVMLGGGRDDFLEARDGARDFVGCGAGRDVVSADTEGEVSADCEAVYRSRTDPTTTSPYKLAG